MGKRIITEAFILRVPSSAETEFCIAGNQMTIFLVSFANARFYLKERQYNGHVLKYYLF